MPAKARSSTPSSRSGATTPRRPSSEPRTRRRALFAAALAAGLCAALPASAPAAPAGADRAAAHAPPVAHAAATRTVKLKDSYFSPSLVTARGTTTLRFVWSGELTHNLDGRGIPDRYLQARKRYKPLLRTYGRGVYRFFCTIHPGMEMKLRVR